MTRLLRVALFLEVGVVLLLVPWSAYWEHNYFADTFLPVRMLMTSAYVRGAVSGLGLVNVAAGIAEFLAPWRRHLVE